MKLVVVDGFTLRQDPLSQRLLKAFLSEGYALPKSQKHTKNLILMHCIEDIIHELQVKKERVKDVQLLLLKLQQ